MNGWIVLWTIKYETPGNARYQDFNRIFIEYSDSEESPKKQAKDLYTELIRGEFFLEDNEEIYSVNLCEIQKSTEAHYTNIEP